MSFWLSDAVTEPIGVAAAGGEASLPEIWSSTRESVILAGNISSRSDALERAYDQRIRAIFDATGRQLSNPMLAVSDGLASGDIIPEEGADTQAIRRTAVTRFDAELIDLARQYPDHAAVIAADRPIADDAASLARAADERAAQMFESRDGIGRWLALLGGGMAGSLRDPAQVAALFVGAGPSTAGAAGTRILSVAAREALISGATEAALQPAVQSWRADIGLDAGWDEAVRDVAGAALLGGVFGAGAGAVGEALRFAGRQLSDRVADDVAAAVLRDDGVLAPDELLGLVEPIADALPDEARGALARLETERAALAQIQSGDLDLWPDDAASRVAASAERAAVEPERIAEMVETFGRELRQLQRRPRDQSLLQFLADNGGLDAGDAARMWGRSDNVFVPGQGQLFRAGGVPLDEAREAAAEAGYFSDIANATSNTDVGDLMDLIDAEIAGDPVFRQGSDEPELRVQVDDLRDEVARLEAIANRLSGSQYGDLPDDILDAASVRLATDDVVSTDDAVEQAIIDAYYRDSDGVLLEDDNGQPIPFDERGDAGPQRRSDGRTRQGDADGREAGDIGETRGQLPQIGLDQAPQDVLTRLNPPEPQAPEPHELQADVDRLRDAQRGLEGNLTVSGDVLIDEGGEALATQRSLSDALNDVEAIRDQADLIRACKAV